MKALLCDHGCMIMIPGADKMMLPKNKVDLNSSLQILVIASVA
jgi:hypothetical protein